MHRLSLLIVTCCAPACLQGGAHNDEVDPAFASVLAARRTPELALPDRPVTSIGRCAIEIGPRSPDTRDRVSAEFTVRNGQDWSIDASSFDSMTMVLRNVGPASRVAGSALALGEDQAVRGAINFVVTNYELFGLSKADLSHVTTSGHPVNDGLIDRVVEFDADNPLPGYQAFPSLAQRWHWSVTFNLRGAIHVATATTSDLLPTLQLCTTPLLVASDPRLTKSVIGYHLMYSDISGSPVDAGLVDQVDIRGIALTVHRERNAERNSVRLRLAYVVSVSRKGLPWEFIVDADTGALIAVEQRFQT